MAVSNPPQCTCCADVIKRDPMTYKYNRRMVTLPNSTRNKKLAVFACEKCDAPTLLQARINADDDSPQS